MSSILTFLMLAILFAALATLYTEGMWSNAVRLINVVTAALLATNFLKAAANWLSLLTFWYSADIRFQGVTKSPFIIAVQKVCAIPSGV